MATHSNILVWKIPRTEEPGELQSMTWQRVSHDLAIEQQAPLYGGGILGPGRHGGSCL